MNEKLSFDVHLDEPYEAALERVVAALKEQGFGVLTKIDVKATMKEKLGEDFRPYAILGACNPPLAHRALSKDPSVGIMLPCNVTVEQDDQGGSIVRIANPETLMMVGGLESETTIQDVAREARERLQRVAAALLD